MSTHRSVAFVCPRFADGFTVGGAEVLLAALARRAVRLGYEVEFLTTCARNHFTWANEIEPGERVVDGLRVRFFPVDADRDTVSFLKAQASINRGRGAREATQQIWLRNSVNSRLLIEHLRRHGHTYERIVAGPYLFGLIYFAVQVHPAKVRLLPCLHDEAFAYLSCMRDLFRAVGGFIFNSEPEQRLAQRLYGIDPDAGRIVGIGIDPFEVTPGAFRAARGIDRPYLIYCGRREPLKGTPLLLDYFRAFRRRTGRDVALVLTGSGPVEIPADLRRDVLDAGFVGEETKRSAMADALVFCHPSVNESLSIVLLESWMSGTPALVHGRGDVLRDQCRKSNGGLWFRCYPEFEESLLLLLDREELRRQMARSGRRYVERDYSWPAVERRLVDALAAGSSSSSDATEDA
jgi:glycosyltransferase involved in cell wall biosynthesis